MSHSRKGTFFPPPPRITAKKGAVNLNSTTLNCDKSDINRLTSKKLHQKVGTKNIDTSRMNTTCSGLIHDGSFSDETEDLEKKLAFNDYLQTLFLDALVDEKIEAEKTEIDIKMAELAKRFEINKVILDKTNSRLKEISFLSEQQRIINNHKASLNDFHEGLEDASTPTILDDLTLNADVYCDRLELKRVDMGFESGQLDSAVRQTSEALDKTSGLYATMGLSVEASDGLDECDRAVTDIEKALKECLDVLPAAGAKLLEGVSNKMATELS